MNPSALGERQLTIGDLKVSQSVQVHVHRSEFYVISCFRLPLPDGDFTFHSEGSGLPFSEAAQLDDDALRQRLAESHLRQMATELRQMLDVADAAVAKVSP